MRANRVSPSPLHASTPGTRAADMHPRITTVQPYSWACVSFLQPYFPRRRIVRSQRHASSVEKLDRVGLYYASSMSGLRLSFALCVPLARCHGAWAPWTATQSLKMIVVSHGWPVRIGTCLCSHGHYSPGHDRKRYNWAWVSRFDRSALESTAAMCGCRVGCDRRYHPKSLGPDSLKTCLGSFCLHRVFLSFS